MWEDRELNKSPRERKPVPVAPKDLPVGTSFQEIEKHNAIVSDSYNKNVMVQCPNCLRTFIEDRLQVHLKSCTSENPHKKPPNAAIIESLSTAVSMKIPRDSVEVMKNQTVKIEKGSTPAKVGYKNPVTFLRPKAIMCHIW